MDSRSRILQELKSRLRATELRVERINTKIADVEQSFSDVLVSIGGRVHACSHLGEVEKIVTEGFTGAKIYTNVPGLASAFSSAESGSRFQDVDLVILRAGFGVAENGAVWITDSQLPDRVLPFITQNLVVLVDRGNVVPTLEEAYDRIGAEGYEFGVFIAGPSKTADIEQSLVLGAHGPKTMTVILVG